MSDDAAVRMDLLRRALDQTGAVVAGVDRADAARPTPCSAWDVAALVGHVVGSDLRNFAAVARGEAPAWGRPPDDPGDDWAGAYRAGAAAVVEAWAAADLHRPVPTPGGPEVPLWARVDQQVAELAAHGWDLGGC